MIYKAFAIGFCIVVAGAVIWILYDSIKAQKKKVNGKK